VLGDADDVDDVAADAAPMSDGRRRGLLLVDAPLHSDASEESWSEEGLVGEEALEAARAPNLLGAMMLDAVLASPASLIRFGELRIANGLLLAPVSNSFGLENIGPTALVDEFWESQQLSWELEIGSVSGALPFEMRVTNWRQVEQNGRIEELMKVTGCNYE